MQLKIHTEKYYYDYCEYDYDYFYDDDDYCYYYIIIIIIIITCINNGTSKKNDADKCDKLSDSLQLKIHTDKYYYD